MTSKARLITTPLRSFTREVKLKQWSTEWFYTVDQKGLLYLEETEPKNYTSCLKDDKFLNFFFKTLKRNDTGVYTQYPWLSICWGEYGFVKSDKFPIVFHTLNHGSESENHDGCDRGKLIYGGTLSVDFNPKDLIMTADGILYHPIKKQKQIGMGMLSSDLLMKLSDKIHHVSGDEFVWKTPTQEMPIKYLDDETHVLNASSI